MPAITSRLKVGTSRVQIASNGTRDVGAVVRAPERGEHVRLRGLHAEADPRDPGSAVRAELGDVDRVGIALDRDLGVRGTRDRVEHTHQAVGRNERRRATAEVDRGGLGELVRSARRRVTSVTHASR